MKKSMIVLFALVLAVSLFSCKSEDGGAGAPGFPGQQGEQGEQGEQGDPGETEYPRLYVAGASSDNVCIFNEAGVAAWSHGDIYPDREIIGPDTTFAYPTGLYFVKTENSSSLYVSDAVNHQILVFSNADTIDGDIAPTKTIESVTVPAEGTAPACDSIYQPLGFVIDNDRLYLANASGDSISIFQNISSWSDGVSSPIPEACIRGSNTQLNVATGIALDEDGRLYVANHMAGEIKIWNDWTALTDMNTASNITMSGLNMPYGLFIDKNTYEKGGDTVKGILYVNDWAANSIYVYYINVNGTFNLSSASSPDLTFTSSSGLLTNPGHVWVDAESDMMYVTAFFNILIWEQASELASGDIGVPDRIIGDEGWGAPNNSQLNSARFMYLEKE
ncbi:MAG: hypothetical protein SVZ03_03335 [Spirochaetota bacterium]|nr:hypothetical protein [Spirochaetota bacterium]